MKKGAKESKNFGKQEKEFVPWDRIKVRFSTPYEENSGPDEIKPILTQIFIGDKEEPEDCTTVRQVESHFMWGCKAQFVLMFSRLWIMTSKDKTCGLGIKCLQIGVTEQPEPRKPGASITKQLNKSLFAKRAPLVISKNSDENTQSVASSAKLTSKVPAKSTASTAPAKVPVKTPVKTPVKAPAKPLAKPVVKTTAKTQPKVTAKDENEENEGDENENVENTENKDDVENTENTENTDEVGADDNTGENADENNEDSGNTSEPEADVPPKKQTTTKGNPSDVKVKAKTVEKNTTSSGVSKTTKKPTK
jgi:hypothetical protein